MNKQPYDKNHLQEYMGILTSDDARSERFKMELKVLKFGQFSDIALRWSAGLL